MHPVALTSNNNGPHQVHTPTKKPVRRVRNRFAGKYALASNERRYIWE